MKPWVFRDFLDSNGRNVILDWAQALPARAQAKMDSMILVLQAWKGPWPPQYVSARTDCDDIYEFRIVSQGVQYRPLGCYGPRQGEFTFLLGAIEKGGKLVPREFCRIVQDPMKVIFADRNRTRDHEFSASATA